MGITRRSRSSSSPVRRMSISLFRHRLPRVRFGSALLWLTKTILSGAQTNSSWYRNDSPAIAVPKAQDGRTSGRGVRSRRRGRQGFPATQTCRGSRKKHWRSQWHTAYALGPDSSRLDQRRSKRGSRRRFASLALRALVAWAAASPSRPASNPRYEVGNACPRHPPRLMHAAPRAVLATPFVPQGRATRPPRPSPPRSVPPGAATPHFRRRHRKGELLEPVSRIGGILRAVRRSA